MTSLNLYKKYCLEEEVKRVVTHMAGESCKRVAIRIKQDVSNF